MSGRISKVDLKLALTTEGTRWRIKRTSDIFSFILSLSPGESVLPCVRRKEKKTFAMFKKKKKSLENESIFSPTLMTTLKVSYDYKMVLFALDLSSCFPV